MGRAFTLVAVLAAALGLSTVSACLDCADDGPLEDAFGEGRAEAAERNAHEHQRGYDEGARLTYADGLFDGDLAGYDDGYQSGYYGPLGYPLGYDEGYVGGHFDGSFDPAACTSGASDATFDGESHGDFDGYAAGYDEAYDGGYADGYADGPSCAFRGADGAPAKKVDPDDLETCRRRGYERTLDRTARERGYAAGKADNLDYQAGFADQYALAYPEGEIHGQIDGHDLGLFEGYDAGYADGYDSSYYVCYDLAYPAAYADGHAQGWADGLSIGYDAGYSTGYAAAGEGCP